MNQHNGNRYVGVTIKGLTHRRRGHYSAAKRGSALRFHGAIRKYGEDAFEWGILAIFEDHDLALIYEEEVIAKTSPTYNTAAGGQGGWAGLTHSDSAKGKMRAAKLGKPGPWKGKNRPPETIEKMRQAKLINPQRYWLGKKRDPALIEKMATANRGRKNPRVSELQQQVCADNMRRAAAQRRKVVRCIGDGSVFPSITAAAKFYGELKSSLSKAINGGYRLHKQTFEFVEEGA